MYLLSFIARDKSDSPHQWMWFRSLEDVNSASRMLSEAGFNSSVQYYANTNDRDVFHISDLRDVKEFILNLDYPEYEEAGIPQF